MDKKLHFIIISILTQLQNTSETSVEVLSQIKAIMASHSFALDSQDNMGDFGKKLDNFDIDSTLQEHLSSLPPEDRDMIYQNAEDIVAMISGNEQNTGKYAPFSDVWFADFTHKIKAIIGDILAETSTKTMKEMSDSFRGTFNTIVKDYERMRSEISTIYVNIIAVLGIFVAITMVFIGGIYIIEALAILSDLPLWEFMFAMSFIGLLIFSMFVSLLFVVAKLTDKQLAMTCRKNKGQICHACRKKKWWFCKYRTKYPYIIYPMGIISMLTVSSFIMLVISWVSPV